MGNMHAASMAEMVDDGAVQLETALAWHLTSNHYPPLPAGLVPVALEVIEQANAGEWDARVDLPAGITWRNQDSAPVSACVDAWHLHAFLEVDDDDPATFGDELEQSCCEDYAGDDDHDHADDLNHQGEE